MSSISELLNEHAKKIQDGLASVDLMELEFVLRVFEEACQNGRTIWVCGNGASASIASHMACDFTKGCAGPNGPRVISLNDNTALMTAISNDVSYDMVYAHQLRALAKSDDVLVVVSSSGNSPSVVNALLVAEELNIRTVAMTGFSGGICAETADFSIHVDVDEYEATEDCHQALMQILAKALRARLTPTPEQVK